MFEEIVSNAIEASIAAKKELLSLSAPIANLGLLAADTLERGNKLLLCGNGGSAADAQHIAAELVVRYKGGNERRGLPAISLATDPSTITACGNDYGYDQLFARAIEAWGQAGDLLIGISTSGNSQNVVNGIEMARKHNIKVATLLGGTGGKIKGSADLEVIVPTNETARIQECHILIGHSMCSIIEKKMFNLD